ncbi:MAG: TldD protein, partial [Thermoleophilaceae bacterium]|nr:TldD protein [Thermoleophilaceae bacterium]
MTLVGHELAARVLERALQHGGDFGEVYAEDRYGFALGLDDSKLERPQTGNERGASVRVVQGDATYFGHVDGLADDDLLRVAKSVSQAVRAGDPRAPAALKAAHTETVHAISERPEEVEAARKAEILRECDERARSEGGEVAQVMASYAENRRIVEIFNSDGIAAGDDRTRVRLGVQVVARRDGRVETGHETLGGHVGFEILSSDPAAV